MDAFAQLLNNTTATNQEREIIASLLEGHKDDSPDAISGGTKPMRSSEVSNPTPTLSQNEETRRQIPHGKITHKRRDDDERMESWDNRDYENILMTYYAMVNPYPMYAIAYSMDMGLSSPELHSKY